MSGAEFEFSGLQLAVEVLVLDRLDLDRHVRVERVVGLHGVLVVRKAGTGVAFVRKDSVTWPLEEELLPPPAQAEAARATPRPSAAIAAARVFLIIVETP
jgi:hypothetical protein